MPKIVPTLLFTKKQADEIIYGRLDKEELNDRILYCIVFSKTVPPLIYPSSFPIENLINLALKKIQELIHKEESHD